jgi:hypothetical protein
MINLNTIFWITLILYILAIILIFTPYYLWGLWIGLIASFLVLYASFINYKITNSVLNLFWIIFIIFIICVWIFNLYKYYNIKNQIVTLN